MAVARIEADGKTLRGSRLNAYLKHPGRLKAEKWQRVRDGFLRAVFSGRRKVLEMLDQPPRIASVMG